MVVFLMKRKHRKQENGEKKPQPTDQHWKRSQNTISLDFWGYSHFRLLSMRHATADLAWAQPKLRGWSCLWPALVRWPHAANGTGVKRGCCQNVTIFALSKSNEFPSKTTKIVFNFVPVLFLIFSRMQLATLSLFLLWSCTLEEGSI